MELTGRWVAHLVDDDLRRDGVGLDHDDTSWPSVVVPGHWSSTAEFAATSGPLLYRHRFHLDPPQPGERRFVTLDGVMYQADVWLDGAYLGDPEGSFFPHTFDITGLARLAADHVLAIEVTAPTNSRRAVVGALVDDDVAAPKPAPGGLWRSVRIESSGPARLDRLRVVCRDANDARAHLQLHARVDLDAPRQVVLRTRVDGRSVSEITRSLAAGPNEVGWSCDVADPRLWWPWQLGEQHLTTVDVEAIVDDAVSDTRSLTTGLREVALQNWVASVNGERLFMKGADLEPVGLVDDSAGGPDARRLVTSARDAGLDLLRVRGHVALPEVYTTADELGMLLWQDLPLRGQYPRTIRKAAVRQAREMVDLLAHHPSVAVWCAHDTPRRALRTTVATATRLTRDRLPNTNTLILDRWVKRAIETADESRPVVAHDEPGAWLGWEQGSAGELDALAAAVPRLVRFVGSFGAASVPTTADFMSPERWPHLPWDDLRQSGLDLDLLDRHTPRRDYATFEEWRDATQRHQAEVLRTHIETLRRLKYRPCGGFSLTSWNDAVPSVGTGIFDSSHVARAALRTVIDACRPVIVVADRMPRTVRTGEAFALDVHVVNDLRRPLDNATCTAVLHWPGGGHTWRWRGSVPTDSCVRVGTLQIVVPDLATGELVLDLTLEHDDLAATNRTRATIVQALPT